jgi:hypothetical protein
MLLTGQENTLPENYQLGDPLLSSYDYLRITDTTEIPIPRPVLTLSGQVIAVNSDIFAISGESKSGKSGFLNMVIAAALTPDGTCMDAVKGMQVEPNPNNHAVLHFDTEQARHKHQYNIKSILRRASFAFCPEYFLSYNLRQLPINQYQSITTGICEAATAEHGEIHSIFIDGGADFVADVNDQANSNELIKYFEELAISFNTAVFIVVHTNPGSNKERGHFGSQLQRKAGGILTIKNENDISVLEAKMLRYAGSGNIEKLIFQYDIDKGYHVGTGILEKQDPEKIRKERKISQATEIAKEVFGGQVSLTYNEALEKIELITLQSINTNKQLFKIMNAERIIFQGDDKRWRYNHKTLNF